MPTRGTKRPPPGPARVLVVTDQELLGAVVAFALNHGRFVTRVVPTAAAAAAALEEWPPHLAVLDVDVVGREAMARLGYAPGRPGRAPVLALTRRGDLKTMLAAFEWGVDDILAVPFSPEELVARVLVIMRRTYGAPAALAPTVTVGELEIDILNRRVRAGPDELHLTPLEQSLLYLLAANAGRLLSRDEILDHRWGVDDVADSNVVDRHVRSLRAKLQNDWRRPRYVATVPGRGYRFVPTEPAAPAAGEGPPPPAR